MIVTIPRPIPTKSNRLLLSLSDLEMGAGGPLDDLPSTKLVESVLEQYSGVTEIPVELILNGDIFDFLKTSVHGVYPHHISEDVALQKLERIARAHPSFFMALQSFLQVDAGHRKIHFVVGNHDQELVFPGVQAKIRELIGADGVEFPGFRLNIGKVHFEHGQQKDPLFQVEEEEPFLEKEGVQILRLPWGSVAILEAVLPLQPYLHQFDRLKPRDRLLSLFPELQEALTSVFWKYWTQDYWKGFWRGGDPLKKMNWKMFQEILYRFRSRDSGVSVRERYIRKLEYREHISLLVIGHEHESHWWSHNNNKLLQTGCFRDEYFLRGEKGSLTQTLLPKSYAEIWMKDEEPVSSSLVEVYEEKESRFRLEGHLKTVLPLIHSIVDKSEPPSISRGEAKNSQEHSPETNREQEDEPSK